MAQENNCAPDDMIAAVEADLNIKVTSSKRIESGATNYVYLLNTPVGERILRQLCTNLDPSALPWEKVHQLHWQCYVNGAPIPRLYTKDLIPYGNTPLQVMKYVAGEPKQEIDSGEAYKLGRAIALFQKVAEPAAELFPKLNFLHMFAAEAGGIARRAVTKPRQEMHYLSSMPQMTSMYFRIRNKMRAERLPEGVVHGDITLGNVIYTANGDVTLLDIDQANKGFLLSDLASAIYFFGMHNDHLDQNNIRELVKGYESVRLLLPQEKQNMAELVDMIAQMSCIAVLKVKANGRRDVFPEDAVLRRKHLWQMQGRTVLEEATGIKQQAFLQTRQNAAVAS